MGMGWVERHTESLWMAHSSMGIKLSPSEMELGHRGLKLGHAGTKLGVSAIHSTKPWSGVEIGSVIIETRAARRPPNSPRNPMMTMVRSILVKRAFRQRVGGTGKSERVPR